MGTREPTEFAKHRTGDYLLGVARYDKTTFDVVFLRDDVRKERIQSQIDRMLDRLQPEATAAEERAFPFGDLHVTVRRFDEAIIMHFPTGNKRGVVMSLEPEATRDLNTFTTECLDRIDQ